MSNKKSLHRDVMALLIYNKVKTTDIAYIDRKSHNSLSVVVFASIALAISYICYIHNMLWFSILFGCLHIATITYILMHLSIILASLYAVGSSMWFIVCLEVSKAYKITGNVDVGSDLIMGGGFGMIIACTMIIWCLED